jgi:autotransporter-associated beta strand protein
MKTTMTSKLGCIYKVGALTLALLAASTLVTRAADRFWSGGTASYTNAAAWGGTVPGSSDNAINDHGTNNVVQINVGDPDWTVNQIRAGNGAGSGAFVQNGQAVTLIGTNIASPAFTTPFRLGIVAGGTGVYTLNGGSINYSNGGFNVGELGTGILNVNGGSISGSGNFADNLGFPAIPVAVTATMDAGTSKTGFTWFEQGFYAPDGTIGLPLAGSTIVSASQADHSYTMAPSYTTSDAVMINSQVTSATITPTPSVACSALSFMGSAGNGPMTVNYTVHHADSTIETGSLIFVDWFGTSTNVLGVGGRVDALGANFQIPGAGGNPHIFSQDVAVTNTVSPVTSINLAYTTGGGLACLLAVSSSSGGAFSPMAMTGYNEDMIVEAGAVSLVSGSVTDIVNQVAGAINVTGGGQLFVGNYGVGIYNLSGGTVTVSNYIAFGRSGGNGTFNMTGGILNQRGTGNLLVGTGFQAPSGGSAVGVLNQSGGTIDSQGQFLCPENSPSTGTYNMSNNAVLNVHNWIAIGRNGGTGVLNISGGAAITHDGGGNFDIGGGGPGTVNQNGGAATNASGQTWIGESSTAIWNLNSGVANLGTINIVQTGSGTGTLNVNGGLLIANEITTGNSLGFSTLNLNGGTVQASANNVNFLHDVTLAFVQLGGVIFDSQGFNITVAESLLDDGSGGGLTKNGVGALTLTGANTYTGATVVNAGTLATTTASTGGGGYTVANGAALGMQVVGGLNSQLNASSVTLASSVTTLNFDLNNFGNPASAPLNVVGALAVNSTVTVNIADATPQLGQFPLIKYGSQTGSGSFVLGSTPFGVVASISNNIANSSIDLVITSVNAPRWEGQAGGNWDIGLTTNWINIGNGLPTVYSDGSAVVFDDSATGTTTVNLVTIVHPQSITINNTNLSYTLIGSGKISGSIGLNKQGGATLSILNTGGNNYTKPTIITGGILSVTNLANGGSPSPIGASSADPTNLVFAGGTFSYAGSPVSVNRGYKVQTSGSTIETLGDLTLSGVVRGVAGGGTFNKKGSGQLAYTGVASTNTLTEFISGTTYLIQDGSVLLDGSAGAQTNYARVMRLGSTAGVNTALILTNTTLHLRNLDVGNFANATATVIMNSNSLLEVEANNFAIAESTAGAPCAAVLTQNAGSRVSTDAELWVGQGPSSTGTYNMNGGSATFRNWVAIGRNGGNGTLNMTGGSILKTNNNNFMIGSRDGTTGTIGTLNQSGGTIICNNEYWIGEAQNNAGAAFGTNNVSGTATVIVNNWIAIGREGAIGVLNLSGGSFTKTGTSGNNIEIGNGTGSSGTINQTGGAFNNTISETRLGTGAPGFWNMSGGTANLGPLVFCNNSGCTNGTLNLNGGVITATEIRANQTGVANVSTLNWNGGTIAAGNGANANFLHNLTRANVQSGGAIIDSGTNVIRIAQPLLDGGGAGGLTKIGNGTLYLNGTNTYTGSTLVSTGALGGTGTILGPVTVASGAALAPGASIGTLTISNSLILAAGSSTLVEVSHDNGGTNDLVAGLTSVAYNGSLVVRNAGATPLVAGSTYKLFDSASSSGNFSSVTVLPAGAGTFNPATGVLTITVGGGGITFIPPALSGGNLILTGTGGNPGATYIWLTTTNLLNPMVTWTTNSTGVFDAAGAFSNAIPVISTNQSQFFRLKLTP